MEEILRGRAAKRLPKYPIWNQASHSLRARTCNLKDGCLQVQFLR